MNPNSFDLSIIIVNYNVEFFLEQCLNSVEKARQKLNIEVFVVDNNSSDGSMSMVERKFQNVKRIENKENLGFAKANNQAIALASGKYILLLNPDTVIEEQTLSLVFQRMEADQNIGGLGVRMVDGKGIFLPESKRGLPTPAVAFYKIFGFSKLFKKSKRFGRYHLSYLPEMEEHEIDILSGAFMCMRKEVLEGIGYLDETFFMYGEDIDLSYRIQKAGFKNLYFPQTSIIHYKGESTKKSSVNYVFVFYRAMVIFAKKHFSQQNASLFSLAINAAIYLRAGIAIVQRFIKFFGPIIVQSAILLLGLFALTYQWQQREITFPQAAYQLMIPTYFIIWTLSYLLCGAFDEPFRVSKQLKGVIIGTGLILILYALLPKELQFSRLYVLIGGLWYFLWNILNRLLKNLLSGKGWHLNRKVKRKFLIIGDEEEVKRVERLLHQTFSAISSVSAVAVHEHFSGAIGDLRQIEKVIQELKIDELIFCAKDISARQIIQIMGDVKSEEIDFKIAQPDAQFIIGSNSIDNSGEMYVLNISTLNRPSTLRSKRLLDVLFAVITLALSPILIFLFNNKKQFLKNQLQLIIGNKTLVGFYRNEEVKDTNLPQLRKGILNPMDGNLGLPNENMDKVNLIYSRDYSLLKDLGIILKHWRKLDRV